MKNIFKKRVFDKLAAISAGVSLILNIFLPLLIVIPVRAEEIAASPSAEVIEATPTPEPTAAPELTPAPEVTPTLEPSLTPTETPENADVGATEAAATPTEIEAKPTIANEKNDDSDKEEVSQKFRSTLLSASQSSKSGQYSISSTNGIWTKVEGTNNYDGLNTEEIRWGSASSGSSRSGLRFDGVGTTTSFNANEKFLIGGLTHFNWPISGSAANKATLKITLNFSNPSITPSPTFTYDFGIEETTNTYNLQDCKYYGKPEQQSQTACDDVITFPNGGYGEEEYTIGDMKYTLKIDGFQNSYPDGKTVSKFITEERKNNEAFLVGHLSSVLVESPKISIIKKVNGYDANTPGEAVQVTAGETVNFTYIVQNTGNVKLTGISVTDNKGVNVSCPKTELDPGTSMTCTGSAKAIAGKYTNIGTVNTTSHPSVTASDPANYVGLVPKIKICHRTASHTSPYEVIEPDASGDLNGHVGHTGDIWFPGITVAWGDIIKPFTYYENGEQKEFTGLNWSEYGQAVYNNDCKIPQGKIIINKVLSPASNDNTEFTIVGSGTPAITGSPTFLYESGSNVGSISRNKSHTYNAMPGTYNIGETVPEGWNLVSNTCSNIEIANNETKECTITNTQDGSLTIVKKALPFGMDSFGFTLTGNGVSEQFSLVDNSGTEDASKTFSLKAGTYAVAEDNYDDWKTTASCTGGQTIDNIVLNAGDSVTCTFANTKYGSISGHKWNDASGKIEDPNTDLTPVSGWTIILKDKNGAEITRTTTDVNGYYKFTGLLPADYIVTEGLEAGWIVLAGDSRDVELNAGNNETNVDFINVKYGSIKVLKNVDVDGNGQVDTEGATDWEWLLGMDTKARIYATGETAKNLLPGVYKVSETQKNGYHITSLVCTNNGQEIVNEASESVKISLESGDNVVCTFTNTRDTGTLIVRKEVVNDNGGALTAKDFSFKIDTGKGIVFDQDPTNPLLGENTYKTFPTGTYTITELEANQRGYATSYNNCDKVEVKKGETAVCTITNNDKAAKLTVIKKVINDNGGTAKVKDFEIKLNDKDLEFKLDQGSVSKYISTYISTPEVQSNTEYKLTEIDHPGYKEGKWSCKPKKDDGTGDARPVPTKEGPSTSFTLSPGKEIVCTITNDDIAPSLQLIKKVVNDNGGTAVATDWNLKAEGLTPISGDGSAISGNKFKAGAYTLSENSAVTGYSASDWNCTNGIEVDGNNGITLGIGQSTVCTITNDDVAPTLKLVKNVDNGHGGPSNANDWTLTAKSETEEFSNLGDADTTHTVTAGVVYTLSETGPEKYEAGEWECTNNIVVDNNNGITLGLGQSTVCTITNTYSPGCIEGEGIGADIVASVTPGTRYDGNPIVNLGSEDRTKPGNALGTADDKFYSLGKDGEIELEFTGFVENVAGNDFSIHEVTWNRDSDKEEKAEVYVKNSNSDWKYLGEASSFSDGNNDGKRDGITHFDFGNTGLPWINAIKLVESSVGQDNNDDGFDLNAIVAASHVCKEPSVSQVKICKVDNKNRPLSGWDVMLKEKVDGPSLINVSNDSGTNSSDLLAGKYLIKVSGTYRYGNSSMNADAGFSYRPQGIPSGCDCWLDGHEISGGLMARVNGEAVNWGAYNDGHVYTYVYDHNGGKINISIRDNIYIDNVNNNNFQFEIFRIPEGYYGTTGNDGCVILNNVLYGDYILDEILKEGWINVSGKGSSVSVDSLEEVFTLVNREDAPVTIVATKIVCNNEADLPNWGYGAPDNITKDTASNFLASRPNCRRESGWSFQWGNDSSTNPGDTHTGEASGWHTFGPTGSDGVATVNINDFGNTSQIKVREVLKENYIPFTYLTNKNNSNNVSAEIYCHTDVLNYDNDDRFIPEYGNTYYCVAWNVEKNPLLSIVKSGAFVDGNANGFADVGETINYSFTVKNEGNVTLTNVTVTDPKVTVIGGPITLNVGQTDATTFTASYVLTQDDVDTGKVDNTATADSDESEPASDDETVTFNTKKPTLTVVKKVVNDNGGDTTINDFEIKLNDDLITFEDGVVDGTTTTYTSTPTVSTKTEYTLSEKDLEGYEEGDWSCIDDTEDNIAMPFTLSAGQNVTCTVTNDDIFGQISVIKFNDVNGNGQMDAGEETLPNWQINLTSQDSKVTNDEGSVVFDKLIPQTYYLSETLQPGWTQTSINCGQDQVRITAPGEAYGHHGVCSGWNGCEDAATCAKWACEAKGYQNLVSYGEVKGCTKFNKCNLFWSRNKVDYNWDNHCDVLGVTDIVCSNSSSTPSLTPMPTTPTQAQNDNNYQIVLDKSKTVQCYIGNRYITPKITLSKSNNVGLTPQKVGNEVVYTLKLKVTDNFVKDLSVIDLPPTGFVYKAGSYQAKVNGSPVAIAEPQYHSPGQWFLGDLNKDDEVELTYTATIQNSVDPGTYKDAAWAYACQSSTDCQIDSSDRVLAQAVNPGYLNTTFVGTQVKLIAEAPAQEYSVNREEIKEGEVLGATTGLPATGASNGWLWVIGSLLTSGMALVFAGIKKNKIMAVILALFMVTLFIPKYTLAADSDLFIALESPASPNNQSKFNLAFTALDMLNRPIVVKCFKINPDNSEVQLGGNINLKAGGNSGNCSLESSPLSESGKNYRFYAVASSGADSYKSEVVSVDYNTDLPGVPTDYSKEKEGSCRFKLSFRASNDGKTKVVRIYRSEQNKFNADSHTQIGEVGIDPGQWGSFTDVNVPDCNKTYYYAIRAFDEANNGSGLAGDSNTIVTTVTTTTTTTVNDSNITDTTGAIRVADSNIPGEEEIANAEESAGEESETSGEGSVLGTTEEVGKNNKIKLLLVGALILIAIIVYVSRRSRRQK